MKLKYIKWAGLALLGVALATNASAKDYFVCKKTGSDKNSGTADAPFKTIQAAADIAIAGDVITAREGVYREWINPKNGGVSNTKRIVYQAAAGEKVEIKGSEIIKGWQKQENSLWKVEIPNSFFGQHNPYKTLIEGDWFGKMGREHHTGEVFLNGKSLYEKTDLAKLLDIEKELNPRDIEGSKLRWFCESDDEKTVIYANFGSTNPNEECVEISTRFTCFYPTTEGLNYITINGFEISQAATQWGAPTAEQIGMIATNWNKGWIIENNIIHDSKCSGITLGKDRLSGHNLWLKNPTKDGSVHYIETTFATIERGWCKDKIGSHIVRNNEIYNCEQTGMCGSQGAAFSLIENNYIHDIWTKRQFDGAEIGGIKFHAPIDTVIRKNRIKNCSRGIWLDWMTQGTRVTQNLLYENTTDDIHVEVNHGPFIIDNNILLSRIGIYVFSGGGAYIHNTISGMFRHFFDGRYTPYHFAHSTRIKGVSTCLDDSKYFNNLFATTNPVKEQANLETYGLWYYNGKTGSFEIDGDTYFYKARPYNKEANYIYRPDFDPKVEIVEETDAIYLVFYMPEGFDEIDSRIISTSQFPITKISNEAFEDAQGNKIVFDIDYLGEKRTSEHPISGAFSNLKVGKNKIKVWCKQK